MPKHTETRYLQTHLATDLTPDQVEFSLAMDRYMRRYQRRFPTWHEVHAVLVSLGYRKVVTSDFPPTTALEE
jgi:hypothetical protein